MGMRLPIFRKQVQYVAVAAVAVGLIVWIYSRPGCFLDFAWGGTCVIDSVLLTGLVVVAVYFTQSAFHLFRLY